MTTRLSPEVRLAFEVVSEIRTACPAVTLNVMLSSPVVRTLEPLKYWAPMVAVPT